MQSGEENSSSGRFNQLCCCGVFVLLLFACMKSIPVF